MIIEQLSNTDISEHLPTLRLLAAHCSHVTEFGVRSGVSTQAILSAGVPSVHYDIEPAPFAFYEPHTFIQASTLEVDIEPTDMLFIDTDHTYVQLYSELTRHSSKVSKYIIMHDTTVYGTELLPAVRDFLWQTPDWLVLAQYFNNNGLLILGRSTLFSHVQPQPLIVFKEGQACTL